MKMINLFLFLVLASSVCYSQSDPIEDFRSHKFPCDSGNTTLEINMCAGVKSEYADSLLNDIYHKIIRSINKEISTAKKELKIRQSKKSNSPETKEDIQFLTIGIDQDQRLKTSIIASQKEWIKLRELNAEVISITCEGGHECVTITNLAEIDDILERIKKLQSFYDL
jgi:uncharacterized protein YecT (DUF1311 family)